MDNGHLSVMHVNTENDQILILVLLDSINCLKEIFPHMTQERLQASLDRKSGDISEVIKEIFEVDDVSSDIGTL